MMVHCFIFSEEKDLDMFAVRNWRNFILFQSPRYCKDGHDIWQIRNIHFFSSNDKTTP